MIPFKIVKIKLVHAFKMTVISIHSLIGNSSLKLPGPNWTKPLFYIRMGSDLNNKIIQ